MPSPGSGFLGTGMRTGCTMMVEVGVKDAASFPVLLTILLPAIPQLSSKRASRPALPNSAPRAGAETGMADVIRPQISDGSEFASEFAPEFSSGPDTTLGTEPLTAAAGRADAFGEISPRELLTALSKSVESPAMSVLDGFR